MTLTNKLVVCGLLIGMAAYSTHTRAEESAQVVKITASKFHFTPAHITLVKGQPVTLQLTSTDSTHGFLLRALKIDRYQAWSSYREDGDADDGQNVQSDLRSLLRTRPQRDENDGCSPESSSMMDRTANRKLENRHGRIRTQWRRNRSLPLRCSAISVRRRTVDYRSLPM